MFWTCIHTCHVTSSWMKIFPVQFFRRPHDLVVIGPQTFLCNNIMYGTMLFYVWTLWVFFFHNCLSSIWPIILKFKHNVDPFIFNFRGLAKFYWSWGTCFKGVNCLMSHVFYNTIMGCWEWIILLFLLIIFSYHLKDKICLLKSYVCIWSLYCGL